MGDEFLSMVAGDPLGRKIRDSIGGFVDGPAENAIAASSPASPDKKGLRFPLDLQNEQFYPEAIRFSIYERTGYELKEIGNTIKRGVARAGQNATASKAAKVALDENRAIKERTESVLAKEKDFKNTFEEKNKNILQETGDTVKDLVGVVERQKAKVDADLAARLDTSQPVTSLVKHIDLQMPESVIFNEQVDWTGTDLGLVGAFISGNLDSGAVAGAIGNTGKILGGAAAGLAGMMGGLSGPAAAVVGAVLGSETGLSGGIESSFNVKANPYKEQTFQGVPFRPFEFQFMFRARNAEEVEAAKLIIESFRAYSKPSFRGSGSGVFQYPHEFRIEFLRLVNDNYETNPHLPMLKYCICKTVNTNYTGQGWKSFQGGAPVDISLTLSFEETEIITQEDVLGQTKYGDFANLKGARF